MARIGVISDTHGLLRPSALEFLSGSDFIVHAGDVGAASILDELAAIAPVTAVRGNVDTASWCRRLPRDAILQVGEVVIYVLHDLGQLDLDPEAAGFHIVVYGHSHRPVVEERGGVWYVNPGSAGPRRLRLPIAAADIHLSGSSIQPRIIELAE